MAARAVLASLLLVACADGDAGLSRAEVEEIVREELANMPAPPTPEPGLTAAEVERIARSVLASIPPKSALAEYTTFFVDKAISLYETQGLDATLAHYNREQSIDGQWYVFIIDENDLVIGHLDAKRLGLDVKCWVGTDANSYNFGQEMLSATEDGKCSAFIADGSGRIVTHSDPAMIGRDLRELFGTETFETTAEGNWVTTEDVRVWVVGYDSMTFGSGWHRDESGG